MSQIPNIQPRKHYDTDQAYYDALRLRYKYLADSYAKKLTYGLCSPHYDELLCIHHKLYQYEVILGIVDQDVAPPDPTDGSTTPVGSVLQNNKIVTINAGAFIFDDPGLQATGTAPLIAHLNTLNLEVARDEILVINYLWRYQSSQFYTSTQALFNPGAGKYGIGEDKVQITASHLTTMEEKVLSYQSAMTGGGVIDLGEISPAQIHDFINASGNTYEISETGSYFFNCTIAGQEHSYLYVGTQPITLGENNNAQFSDFDLLNQEDPEITKTSQLTNDGANEVDPFITLNDLPEFPVTTLLPSITFNDITDTQYFTVADSGEVTRIFVNGKKLSYPSEWEIADASTILIKNSLFTGQVIDIEIGSEVNYDNVIQQVADRLLPISTDSTVITFDTPRTFNTPFNPITTQLSCDFSNAKVGQVQKIYHSNSWFTPPPSFVLVGGGYEPSALNIIYAEYCGGSRVEYWVAQEL